MRTKAFLAFAAVCFVSLAAGGVQAATYYWDTSTAAGYQGGNGDWSEAKWTTDGTTLINWADTNAPFFSTTGSPSVVTLNQNVAAGNWNMRFSSQPVTVSQTGGAVTTNYLEISDNTAATTLSFSGGSFTNSGATYLARGTQTQSLNVSGTANVSLQEFDIGWDSGLASVQVSGGQLSSTYIFMGAHNGSSSSVVTQTGGTVTANNLEVGNTSSSPDIHYDISGGTLNVPSNLYLGNLVKGTLNVSGTASVSVGAMWLGYQSNPTGVVNQSGGTVAVSNNLYIGRTGANDNAYILSAGALNVTGSLEAGYTGTGRLTQSGGDVTITNGGLRIGETGSGVGQYSISGGTLTGGLGSSGDRTWYIGVYAPGSMNISGTAAVVLNSNLFVVSYQGAGTVTQTGGSVTIGNGLHLGETATGNGTYDLQGGTVSITGGNSFIGVGGQGTLKVSGSGTLTSTVGEIDLANNDNSTGTVLQSGGTLNANNGLVIARGTGATGTYTISAGSLNIGSGGDKVWTAWSGASTKAFLNISGSGAVALNGSANFSGNGTTTITQTGGSFTTTNGRIVMAYNAGSSAIWNLSGGSMSTTGSSGDRNIYVGFSGTGTVNVSGSGSLTAGYEIDIAQNDNSTGTIAQSGGSVASSALVIARGAATTGTYSISAGTLTVTGGGDRMWTGWNAATSNALLNISGTGAVSVAGNVNFCGNGSTTVTQTGGSFATTNGFIKMGMNNGSVATYNLSGGTLATTGASGDRNFYLGWDGATSQGNLSVSGTGTVNAGSILYVGGNGSGTVTMTGGAVTVTSLTYLGLNAGSSGTLNLNGGTFTTPALIKGSGSGAIAFGGGTLRASNTFNLGIPVTINAGGATFDTNGNTVTLDNTLSGTGGLTKAGAGTLVLGAPTAYAGATTVSAGTLKLIAPPPPTPAGAVAYYPFNDGTATDVVGGNNGTFQGNAYATPGAAVFDGNGDYVQLPAALAGLFSNAGTVSLWAKLNLATPTDGAKTGLMGFGGTGSNHYPWTDGTAYSTVLRADNNRVNGIALSAGIPRDQWHMLTVTSDPAGGWNMYQNGTLVASAASVFGIANWTIGRDVAGWYFNGMADQLALFNRALSGSEVASLYAAGRGMTGNFLPDTAPITVSAGATLDLSGQSETVGPLAGGGNVLLGAGTLTVNSTANSTFTGVLSGTGGLAKIGSGAFTLGGASTYSGPTTVAAGKLLVDGSIGTGGSPTAVTVTGGMLGGNGTINGAVNVAAAGTVSAGDSPGHLIVNGAYNLSGTMLAELGGTTQGTGYDWIQVNGVATLANGSIVDVDAFNNWPSPGEGVPYYILTATGGINPASLAGVTFDFSGAPVGPGTWKASVVPWPAGGSVPRPCCSRPSPSRRPWPS